MEKNKTIRDKFRLLPDKFKTLSRLERDLSELERKGNDIQKAKIKKIKAFQSVVDEICIDLRDIAEKDKKIHSLLQSLKETTSTLKTLLTQQS